MQNDKACLAKTGVWGFTFICVVVSASFAGTWTHTMGSMPPVATVDRMVNGNLMAEYTPSPLIQQQYPMATRQYTLVSPGWSFSGGSVTAQSPAVGAPQSTNPFGSTASGQFSTTGFQTMSVTVKCEVLSGGAAVDTDTATFTHTVEVKYPTLDLTQNRELVTMDGTTSVAMFTAFVKDAMSMPMASEEVEFSTDLGEVGSTTVTKTTGPDGKATASLRGSGIAGTANVTAKLKRPSYSSVSPKSGSGKIGSMAITSIDFKDAAGLDNECPMKRAIVDGLGNVTYQPFPNPDWTATLNTTGIVVDTSTTISPTTAYHIGTASYDSSGYASIGYSTVGHDPYAYWGYSFSALGGTWFGGGSGIPDNPTEQNLGPIATTVQIMSFKIEFLCRGFDSKANQEVILRTGQMTPGTTPLNHRLFVVLDKPVAPDDTPSDLALGKACGYANGKNSAADGIPAVRTGVHGEVAYDGSASIETDPLQCYFPPGVARGCINHANLLAKLSRSIGVPATVDYVWGGVGPANTVFLGKNVRIRDPNNRTIDISGNRWFYHAVANVNGTRQDSVLDVAGVQETNCYKGFYGGEQGAFHYKDFGPYLGSSAPDGTFEDDYRNW